MRQELEDEARLRAEQLEASRAASESKEKELAEMVRLRAEQETASTEQAAELEAARKLATEKEAMDFRKISKIVVGLQEPCEVKADHMDRFYPLQIL